MGHFCLFTPLTTKKFKISKTWKKLLEISSFYASVRKCVTDVIFIFKGLFSALNPLTALKIKILKKWYVIILHMCTKNYDQMMYVSWGMVRNERTDGRTDERTGGWTEKVTYRGGCPTWKFNIEYSKSNIQCAQRNSIR